MAAETPAQTHGFAASRDPEMLRSAVEVTAERPDARTLTVRILPRYVGHAVPTGDPFRRLVVEVDVDGGEGWLPLHRKELQRHFERAQGISMRRTEVRDDRVGARDDESLHTFDLGGEPDSVRWRVAYERVDHPFGAQDPIVFGRISLASGEFSSPGDP